MSRRRQTFDRHAGYIITAFIAPPLDALAAALRRSDYADPG